MRYLSPRELVSASTDSTLRMWDVQAHRDLRTFSGHMNEKNFVGLSVDGDFTACGSETNEVGGGGGLPQLWGVFGSWPLCSSEASLVECQRRSSVCVPEMVWRATHPRASAQPTVWEEAEKHAECSMQHPDVAWGSSSLLACSAASWPCSETLAAALLIAAHQQQQM